MTNIFLPASDSFTRVEPSTWAGKIIQFPLVRIVIAIAFLFPASFIHQRINEQLKAIMTEGYSDWVTVINATIGILLLLASYWLYTLLIERRPAPELSLKHLPVEFFQGMFLAVLLIGSSLSVIELIGSLSIKAGEQSGWVLAVGLFRFGAPALIEEIIFRLILFRLTEEWLGSWPAVAVQAILFGSAHLSNPNATIWSSISIAVSAGLLLAALYIYTRRLWLVWSIHLGWNYLQSSVLGLPVSGKSEAGFWQWEMSGPLWLTGGEFGIEASVVTVVVCVIASVIIFNRCAVFDRFVAPSWKRRSLIDNCPQE